MAQIIAWKCDITGDIFEDQTLYKKHVRKVSAELRKKAETKMTALLDELI